MLNWVLHSCASQSPPEYDSQHRVAHLLLVASGVRGPYVTIEEAEEIADKMRTQQHAKEPWCVLRVVQAATREVAIVELRRLNDSLISVRRAELVGTEIALRTSGPQVEALASRTELAPETNTLISALEDRGLRVSILGRPLEVPEGQYRSLRIIGVGTVSILELTDEVAAMEAAADLYERLVARSSGDVDRAIPILIYRRGRLVVIDFDGGEGLTEALEAALGPPLGGDVPDS